MWGGRRSWQTIYAGKRGGYYRVLMTRPEQQLAFVLEIDKLKRIRRRTRLLHAGEELGRFEKTAEHSWHITLMAVVFAEHSNEAVDIGRVIRMLLVHDLVEIDAGDTSAFGEQGSKEELEAAGAERIFGLLPADQGRSFWSCGGSLRGGRRQRRGTRMRWTGCCRVFRILTIGVVRVGILGFRGRRQMRG